eukprot:CAMPEP_0114524432 /NCGR_PEP_ID=MMETSP0109-20121206/21852_1 /TAXON_ID=29199 /ORGANISM="Chlorarachnion reptans, Strain CCCM449" /LENGTH=77 /DNA_ID=CAMNT_0001705875 /DNA_START=142 /DNA_END=375 /DNA_ORIENTATION=+
MTGKTGGDSMAGTNPGEILEPKSSEEKPSSKDEGNAKIVKGTKSTKTRTKQHRPRFYDLGDCYYSQILFSKYSNLRQ